MLVCLHHLLLSFQRIKWLGKQSCCFGPNSDAAGEKKINQKLILHLSDNSSIYSVQFSHSVVSDSLRPHELQHTRPPCPSPSPRVHSNSRRVSDALQPSHPLSSTSPPAPNPSQNQSLFQRVNSSHEVAKVLEFQL